MGWPGNMGWSGNMGWPSNIGPFRGHNTVRCMTAFPSHGFLHSDDSSSGRASYATSEPWKHLVKYRLCPRPCCGDSPKCVRRHRPETDPQHQLQGLHSQDQAAVPTEGLRHVVCRGSVCEGNKGSGPDAG
ncbi:unnamed protein product [Rangifer tarandus platyrhynchus]|uniref:Uncharacterized protein n=2 Tax=Rangifer tarandus platyrhynchus TaxID=3082113 RepID=A0ACB0EEW8_RANTA|nr:unnamed protein product [Rangifer tarandus platyrhynchus]CAI9698806.1 unnamed protein product [Rangifer tarandus platyrhynchus]